MNNHGNRVYIHIPHFKLGFTNEKLYQSLHKPAPWGLCAGRGFGHGRDHQSSLNICCDMSAFFSFWDTRPSTSYLCVVFYFLCVIYLYPSCLLCQVQLDQYKTNFRHFKESLIVHIFSNIQCGVNTIRIYH